MIQINTTPSKDDPTTRNVKSIEISIDGCFGCLFLIVMLALVIIGCLTVR